MAGKNWLHGTRVPNAAVAITPSDTLDSTTELPSSVSCIYVGGAGAVKAVLRGGGTVTFAAVPVGTQLFGNFKYVYSTGTAATNLLALYTV